jgi:protein-tyrosine phosphatase
MENISKRNAGFPGTSVKSTAIREKAFTPDPIPYYRIAETPEGGTVKRLREYAEAFLNRRYSGIFRRIPLDSDGALYVSPLPGGAYDPGHLLKVYKLNRLDHIFPLVTDEELKKKARKNIFSEYRKLGMSYSRHIIRDLQAPDLGTLRNLVNEAVILLKNGKKILVHCHAGVGRTALAVICILMTVNGTDADEAMGIVNEHMMVNIVSDQRRLIRKFHETYLNPVPAGPLGMGTMQGA